MYRAGGSLKSTRQKVVETTASRKYGGMKAQKGRKKKKREGKNIVRGAGRKEDRREGNGGRGAQLSPQRKIFGREAEEWQGNKEEKKSEIKTTVGWSMG